MKTKRLLAGLLTLVMLVGLLPTAALAARMVDDEVSIEAPADEALSAAAPVWTDPAEPPATLSAVSLPPLVNIASGATISHSGSGACDESTWTDGNDATESGFYGKELSATGDDAWVQLDLGKNYQVSGVRLAAKADDATHWYTCDIYTKGADDADWTTRVSNAPVKRIAGENVAQTTFASLADVRYVKYVLHQAGGGSWGAISELSVFAQLPPLDLSTLTNIAADGTVSTSTPVTNQYTTQDHPEYLTDGNTDTEFKWVGQGIRDYIAVHGKPWVNLNFGENRSIGGLQVTFEHKDPDGDNVTYKYNVLGKASGATEYETLFSNCTATKLNDGHIQTYPFGFMKELSDIKIEFTEESSNAWIVMTQLEVFGEASGPDPYEGLVEVASLSTITVPSNEDDAGKIVDGKLNTMWAAASGKWPANVDFALPGNLLIKRVEIDFEHYDGRTFDLSLAVALNNILDTFSKVTEKTGHSANETYVYTFPEAQRVTHLRASLLGTNGQAYPAIAEARIYVVDEKINLDDYDNITDHATKSSGDGYKEWDFDGNQQIMGFRATLSDGVKATLKGKLRRGGSWTTYFTELQNGDNTFRFPAGMSVVRVELSDPSRLSDLKIFGTYTPRNPDSGSIAYDIIPHTNFGSATAYLLTDGSTDQPWTAEMYPVYIDIDLKENYNLSQIEVYAPADGQTEYTLYTSIDGNDFTFVDEAQTSGLKTHALSNVEARVVRVYVEYYSLSDKPALNEIRVMGTPSGTAVQTAPDIDADITPFAQTPYAAEVTPADTIKEVQDIIKRQVGEDYISWFDFAIAPDPSGNSYDYFTLENAGGKIKVTGNNGVSLATGVNHYLKYYCNVHISQVGNQVNMPAQIVAVPEGGVHKETKYPVRYAYNYCTHSYTMSFWNEEEWRNELDWQALNGVNVVLDITGQEAVWREFLMSIGYTHEEAKDFLAGPGYYAWAYMANLTGFGGPVNDRFIVDRTELARKNMRTMRLLGMEPVLQAYGGMVPVDLTIKDPEAQVVEMGKWNEFQRPAMLYTDSTKFDHYADLFYKAQEKILGPAKYFATDPFHEAGHDVDMGNLNDTIIARSVLDSMLDYNPNAVWVIQSWQGNPTNGLLTGLRASSNPTRPDRRSHALILDLWAEHDPHNNEYGADTDGDGIKEFSDTPWVWCMLNNFGGRMGLHGHLDDLQKSIPSTANAAKHMAGVGMSPEGAQENPVLYDFLFETIWTDNASQDLPTIDLDQWLKSYVTRRYGGESENAYQAMLILADTVYKDSLNQRGQGSPESVINARPALSIGAASTWGNSVISYDKLKLEEAAELLLKDYDTLKESDAYLYDVADVLKQVLSNTAQNLHSKMAGAYSAKNTADFNTLSSQFLTLIDTLEQVLGTRSEFTFGKWTGGAVKMAKGSDDFTKRLYLRNAKALVTTWGSIQQCNAGGLKDYSNRQWSGLTKDFYKARWTRWIDQAKANLAKNSNAAISIDWFPWEWSYARSQTLYSDETNGLDLQTLGEKVLTDYSLFDPAASDKNDLPIPVDAKAGSQHYGSDEDDRAIKAIDNTNNTIWHTEWSPKAPKTDWWIALDLGEVRSVDGLRYLPRQNGNSSNAGYITGYEIYVSNSETDWDGTTNTWSKVAEGSWADNSDWKLVGFNSATSARYVKLVATKSSYDFVSAAELRVTGTVPVTGITLSETSLTLYANEDHANHTATLTATVAPEQAADKAVTWTTGNVEVAAVNSTTGVVTAMGVGETTITATAHDGSGVTATCTVTVKEVIEGTVSVSGALKFGSQLTASGDFDPAVSSSLIYTWYRGEGTSGTVLGTGTTYTPVKDDIGSKLTVEAAAAADSYYEVEATFTTVTAVTKADGHKMLDADPTYENCSANGVNDGKITGLRADHVYQYQKQNDDGEWPTDEASWTTVAENSTEIISLAPGSYRLRHIGDETRFPGEPSNTVTIVVEGGSEKKLTISQSFTGGAVRANRSQIPANDPVTLTVTPDAGYELTTLTVNYTDETGAHTLEVTKNGEGKYVFSMPNADVTVAATFTKITYTISHGLTNITCNEAEHQHTATYEVPFSIILTPKDGYNMPNTLTVTETGTTTRFTDFTYEVHATDSAKRVLTFPRGVTCNITVEGAATLKTYTIDHQLTDIACNVGTQEQHRVTHGEALTVRLTAAQGYYLPQQVTVKMSGQAFGDFTYTRVSDTEGQLTIASGKITGPLVIEAAGVIPLTSVTVQGTAQVGQTLTAQVLPTAAKVSYQWFRGETAITDATGKTYTLTEADLGATVKVQATGVEGYTGTKTSTPVGPVAPVPIPIDKSALQAAITDAEAVTKGNYTDESWNALQTAIAAAKGVLDNEDASLDDVDDAIAALNAAKSALAENPAGPVNKTALRTAVADAEAVTKGNYTDASWNTLQAAITAAKEVLDHDAATQADVDAAVTRLTQAKAALAQKPTAPSTSSSSSSATTPTTETKEDGTKVTTEVKPDGTKVETVEEPDGTKAVTETKKDGTVTEKVEEPDGTKAVTETKPDGSKTATVEQADGTKSETVVTAEGDATVTVTDPDGEELAKVEIPAVIPEPETKFEDISVTPWAEEAINKVAGLELVKGIGGNKYDPVTPMTRGALATVLHRLSNGKTDYEVAFKDVAANRYYTEGVAWAAKANVVKGVSQDIFAPDQIITREQLAVMLARYAKLIGMSTKADAKSLEQFADGDSTGAWAVDGVAWCVEKGILKGKGANGLDPTANVSRAEVAVMLDRFIALIQK